MFFAHVSLRKESWIFLSVSYFRCDSLSVGHESGSGSGSGDGHGDGGDYGGASDDGGDAGGGGCSGGGSGGGMFYFLASVFSLLLKAIHFHY